MPLQRYSVYHCHTVKECSEMLSRLEDFGAKGSERIRISRKSDSRRYSRRYVPELSKRPSGLVRKIEKLGFKSNNLRYANVSFAIDDFMYVNRDLILDSICSPRQEILNLRRLGTLGALNDHFGKDCENLASIWETAQERIQTSCSKAKETIENREDFDERLGTRRKEVTRLLRSEKRELEGEYRDLQVRQNQKIEEVKESHQTELENLEKAVEEKIKELEHLETLQEEAYLKLEPELKSDLEQFKQKMESESELDQVIDDLNRKIRKKSEEIDELQKKIAAKQQKSSPIQKRAQKEGKILLDKVQESRVVLYQPLNMSEINSKILGDITQADVSIFCQKKQIPIECHFIVLQSISEWFSSQLRLTGADKDWKTEAGHSIVKFPDYPRNVVQALLTYAYTMELPDLFFTEMIELLKLNDFLQTPAEFKLKELLLKKICTALQKPENLNLTEENIERIIEVTEPYFDKDSKQFDANYASLLSKFLLKIAESDTDLFSDFWKFLEKTFGIKSITIASAVEKFATLPFTALPSTEDWMLWSSPDKDLWVIKYNMDVFSVSAYPRVTSPLIEIPTVAKFSFSFESSMQFYSEFLLLRSTFASLDNAQSNKESKINIRAVFLNDYRLQDCTISTSVMFRERVINGPNGWSMRDLRNGGRNRQLFIIISQDKSTV